MDRMGRWGKVCALCCLFAATGCGNTDSNRREPDETVYSLHGRAFGSESGKSLTNASVRVDDSTVESDGKGSFALSYSASNKSKSVEIVAKDHAPLTKAAPKGDGYLEVFAKIIDEKQVVEADKGGVLKSRKGASLSIKAGSLETKDRKAPSKVLLTMAVPDANKATELDALPGDFTAKKGQKMGKVAAVSPVYFNASEKEQGLKLKPSQKATLTLPAKAKNTGGQKQATQFLLFHFDEAQGIWTEVGPAVADVDADGLPIYVAEVDGFGWFTVGAFIGELSCIRACVVREDQSAVPFARAVATGVDLFTQSTAFAGPDGCVELDVPANSRLTLAVQSEGMRAAPQLVRSPLGGGAGATGTCLTLPPVIVAPTDASSCPLGFAQCGEACVDIGRDPSHCGACDQSCGEELCAAARCVGPDVPASMDEPDAGADPVADAGADAEVCIPAEEDCFNGLDDDCDTLTDCEDSECEGPAVCGAEGSQLGFLQPLGTTCPAGTVADTQPLHQAPQTGSCSGCSCGVASPTSCVATVSGWRDSCSGTPITPLLSQITSYTCNGSASQVSYDTLAGFRAVFSTTSGTCPPNGTPARSALSWGSDAVFCRITRAGQGCGSGQICLPRNEAHPTAALCEVTANSCAPSQTSQTWYTGADDGRTCGACSCTATGASCANVRVRFGNDYTCDGAGTTPDPLLVGDGQTVCGYAYGPQAMLVGTPTPATCAASSSLQGSVLPLGATTLCCNP